MKNLLTEKLQTQLFLKIQQWAEIIDLTYLHWAEGSCGKCNILQRTRLTRVTSGFLWPWVRWNCSIHALPKQLKQAIRSQVGTQVSCCIRRCLTLSEVTHGHMVSQDMTFRGTKGGLIIFALWTAAGKSPVLPIIVISMRQEVTVGRGIYTDIYLELLATMGLSSTALCIISVITALEISFTYTNSLSFPLCLICNILKDTI